MPAIAPLQDSLTAPELMKHCRVQDRHAAAAALRALSQPRQKTVSDATKLLRFTFCTGHRESPSRSLLAHVPDEEHQLLQPP